MQDIFAFYLCQTKLFLTVRIIKASTIVILLNSMFRNTACPRATCKTIVHIDIRPDKLDLLFLISHFLDLGAGGRLLFITSLFNLMSRSHEACLT